MRIRATNSLKLTLGAACLVAAFGTSPGHADSSIRFNGTTSKIQDDSADVLDGSGAVTICAWVYPASAGEGGAGVIVALDKDGNAMSVQHDGGSEFAFHAQWDSIDGKWLFPLQSNTWSAVAVSYGNSSVHNNPDARVNFAAATRMQDSDEPEEHPITAGTSYCIGNFSDGSRTWDGRIAHVQIFNRILSPDEMDACLQAPGSVTNGLRLWLPMTNATDIKDRSTNGFDGTGTALATDVSGPMITGQPGVLSGVTILSHGVTNKTQHEIPRYANGVTYPGGQLRGVGPASVLRGTADTDNQTVKAVVITEDYDTIGGIAEYQSDTEETPAVLQVQVKHLSVSGHDETETDYAAPGLVNNQPNLWNKVKGVVINATATEPIRITSPFYSLPNGATIVIDDVDGLEDANGSHTVTRLIGSITALADDGDTTVVTSAGHNLQDGTSVIINITSGNMAANGTRVVTVIDANSFSVPVDGAGGTGTGGWQSLDIFSLDGTDGDGEGPYTPGTGTWTSNHWGDKYHGVLLRGSGLLVKDVNLFYFPGTALEIHRGGAGGPDGPRLPFDRENSRVWDCKVNRAYRGILINAPAFVGRLEGFALRDYGIKFTAPGVQIDGELHFYGVGMGGVDEPAVWFATGADNCVGGPIYAESSPITMLIESSGNRLGPIHSHHGFSKNIVIKGERNSLGPIDVVVEANATGVTLQGPHHKFWGGSVELEATSAVGVHVESGTDSGKGLVIRDIRFFGRQIPAGGTAFTANALLNNCTIEAHFQSLDTGIDLNPGGQSRIGTNNNIRITTTNVLHPIKLPSTWDDVSNRIWVNGDELEDN